MREKVTDAQKEFTSTAQIGFGLDGDEETARSDFEAVRGQFDKNSFVSEIKKHTINKTALAEKFISQMEKLR